MAQNREPTTTETWVRDQIEETKLNLEEKRQQLANHEQNRNGIEYWINHYETLLRFLEETQLNLTRAIDQNPAMGENIVGNPQSLLGGKANGGVMVSSHRRRKPKEGQPETPADQPEVIDERDA